MSQMQGKRIKTIIGLLFAIIAISACENKGKELDSADTEIKIFENRPPSLSYHGVHTYLIDSVTGEPDTIHHVIRYFEFINQNGDTISRDDYLGKIYIADFFFTSCPTMCPIMSNQMVRLQSVLKGKLDYEIVSFTVDPERDTLEALREYADRINADTSNWNFLTGIAKEIYEFGNSSFMAVAGIDNAAAGGFIHSNLFFLVDKEGRIRGLYNGEKTEEVNLLIKEIQLLNDRYEK